MDFLLFFFRKHLTQICSDFYNVRSAIRADIVYCGLKMARAFG